MLISELTREEKQAIRPGQILYLCPAECADKSEDWVSYWSNRSILFVAFARDRGNDFGIVDVRSNEGREANMYPCRLCI
jgi:hypothetical protein